MTYSPFWLYRHNYMNLFWRVLFIAAFILPVACSSTKQPTPTPFIPTNTPINRQAGQLLDIPLMELAANPANFEGARLRVNGRYQPMPRLICSTNPYRSPATWALTGENLTVHMGSFDEQLRQLLPEDITMTVIGTWRQWQGPVGCGKQAVTRQLWYLDVSEIVSPNPITMRTLTPTVPDTAIEETNLTPTAVPTDTETTPDATTAVTPTTDQFQPTPTETSSDIITSTPTVTQAATTPLPTTGAGTATVTATPTITPTTGTDTDSSTATPTPTPTTGSGSSTGTATPTPTPTSTADLSNAIFIDELAPEDLGFERLDQSQTHIWSIELFSGQEIIASVAAQSNVDVTLSLFAPDGQTLISVQNLASAGQVETISNITATMDGEYELHIKAANNTSGYYVVNISLADFPSLFRGILSYGDVKTVSLSADSYDFWHFYGNAGETVTITVLPSDDQADLAISLWGADGELADSDSIDPGETEIINSFALPEDNIYSIQIKDWDQLNRNYTIRLTQN